MTTNAGILLAAGLLSGPGHKIRVKDDAGGIVILTGVDAVRRHRGTRTNRNSGVQVLARHPVEVANVIRAKSETWVWKSGLTSPAATRLAASKAVTAVRTAPKPPRPDGGRPVAQAGGSRVEAPYWL